MAPVRDDASRRPSLRRRPWLLTKHSHLITVPPLRLLVPCLLPTTLRHGALTCLSAAAHRGRGLLVCDRCRPRGAPPAHPLRHHDGHGAGHGRARGARGGAPALARRRAAFFVSPILWPVRNGEHGSDGGAPSLADIPQFDLSSTPKGKMTRREKRERKARRAALRAAETAASSDRKSVV